MSSTAKYFANAAPEGLACWREVAASDSSPYTTRSSTASIELSSGGAASESSPRSGSRW